MGVESSTHCREGLANIEMYGVRVYSSGSGEGPVAGCCEHGDEHSDCTKGGGWEGCLASRASIGL
jgi:hypothetical protein